MTIYLLHCCHQYGYQQGRDSGATQEEGDLEFSEKTSVLDMEKEGDGEGGAGDSGAKHSVGVQKYLGDFYWQNQNNKI